MGGGCSSLSPPLSSSSSCSLHRSSSSTTTTTTTKTLIFTPPFSLPIKRTHPPTPIGATSSSSLPPEGPEDTKKRSVPEDLVGKMTADALVWSALHGLVVGDRSAPKSGTVPGVGLVHAPFSLLSMIFPRSHWSQACELAPIFNELVDRVSVDGNFLQNSLFRTKKVDAFTGRLLDIHSKMLEIKKTEEFTQPLWKGPWAIWQKQCCCFGCRAT